MIITNNNKIYKIYFVTFVTCSELLKNFNEMKFMTTIFKNICLLILFSEFPAFAQTTLVRDSLLDHMAGEWTLQGTIGSQETTHDIIAEWVLGHQYILLRETSREKYSDGKPSYEAMVFITPDQTLNQYVCLWLDNTGNGGLSAQAVGHANRNGDKIEFLFKITDSNTFHTTFLYDNDTDTWQWKMDNEDNNKLESFARVKLTRKQINK